MRNLYRVEIARGAYITKHLSAFSVVDAVTTTVTWWNQHYGEKIAKDPRYKIGEADISKVELVENNFDG